MTSFAVFLIVFASLLSVAVSADLKTYSSLCDSAFCNIINESLKTVSELKVAIDSGSPIAQFGQKADEICNSAIERFSHEAPLPADGKDFVSVHDRKVEELEKVLDSPLHVLYLKQLSILREKALKTFKSSVTSTPEGGNEYEAMLQVDEIFRREAEESTRQNPDWDYSRDVSFLKQSLSEVASRVKKIQEIKLGAAKQSQQSMQYLQQQQQQLQAIQQQIQGSSSPWSGALAYRLPDSNINLSYNYQQGKNNIQISCVPDEAVPLLGPNGFVNGVTPGNIGLSFNINL